MKDNLVNKLWDMANMVAGFSAVQTMAFSFFALNQLNHNRILPVLLECHGEQDKVFYGTLIGTVFYILAIYGCQRLAKSLMSTNEWNEVSHVWCCTTIGRIAVVVLFGIITTGVLIYGPSYESSYAQTCEIKNNVDS